MRSLYHEKPLNLLWTCTLLCNFAGMTSATMRIHVFQSLKCYGTCLIEHHIALLHFSTFTFICPHLNVPEISVYEIFITSFLPV